MIRQLANIFWGEAMSERIKGWRVARGFSYSPAGGEPSKNKPVYAQNTLI